MQLFQLSWRDEPCCRRVSKIICCLYTSLICHSSVDVSTMGVLCRKQNGMLLQSLSESCFSLVLYWWQQSILTVRHILVLIEYTSASAVKLINKVLVFCCRSSGKSVNMWIKAEKATSFSHLIYWVHASTFMGDDGQ